MSELCTVTHSHANEKTAVPGTGDEQELNQRCNELDTRVSVVLLNAGCEWALPSRRPGSYASPAKQLQ